MMGKLCQLSKRWELTALLFSGIAILYCLRVNMSVAGQKLLVELHWTEQEKGLVLSSFYWGYALGQIPAARCIQYTGAKVLFLASVLIPSILSLFVPIACRHSVSSACIVRMLIGLFESASFPAVYYFLPVWIPPQEKTLLIPFVFSGIYFGEMIGFYVSGVLVNSSIVLNGTDYGNWPSLFYIFGVLGVLWSPVWAFAAFESPERHPFISPEEKQLILLGRRGQSLTVCERSESVPSPIHVTEEVKECLDSDSQHRPAVLHESSSSTSTSALSFGTSVKRYSLIRIHAAEEEAMSTGDEIELTPVGMVDLMSSRPTPPSIGEAYCGHCDSNVVIDGDNDDDNAMQEREFQQNHPPWRAFFTHPVAITLLVNGWVYGWINFLLLSEMPAYVTDVLKFSLKDSGSLCMLTYFAVFASTLLFGRLFSDLKSMYGLRVGTVRLWAMVIAFGVTSLLLVGASFITDRHAAFAVLLASQSMLGAVSCGFCCSFTDVAPRFSALLNTIANTCGALAGMLGPILVAAVTTSRGSDGRESKDSSSILWGWRVVFYLTASVSALSLTLWALYMKDSIIPELNSPTQALTTHRASRLSSEEEI